MISTKGFKRKREKERREKGRRIGEFRDQGKRNGTKEKKRKKGGEKDEKKFNASMNSLLLFHFFNTDDWYSS